MHRKLTELAAIPVIYGGGTGGSAKNPRTRPSLLEAIRDNLLLLDGLVFSWFSYEGHDLSRGTVARQAKRRRIQLPDSGVWDWYQTPNTTGLMKRTLRTYGTTPIVHWGMQVDSAQLPMKFYARETVAAPLVGAFPVGQHFVSIVATRPAKTR